MSTSPNDQLKLVARNGSEMTLESVFEVAAMTAAPASASASTAAPVQNDEEKEIALVPAQLQDKFRSYLHKLKDTIYFKDVEEGTPAYSKRVQKAREKFLRKYGDSSKAAPSSSSPAAAAAGAAAAAAPVASSSSSDPDSLKNAGNERLKQGDYEGAIKLYSDAIALRKEAVYFSNRAAAYQYLFQHEKAVDDARMCVQLDKSFHKGYMRLGHSLVALGRFQQAIDEGFEPALALQPNDPATKEALNAARAQLVATSRMANDIASTPGIAQMAEQIAAGRGGAGGGGMPGLEDLMNPEMMRMAMEAMRDPSMQEMMRSPMFQNMAAQV